VVDPKSTIRRVEVDETDRVVDVIVAAFLTDPIGRFAWPSVSDYLRHMPRATLAFAGASIEHQTAFAEHGLRGAAMWMAPGVFPDGEALEKIFRDTVAADRIDDLLGTFGAMETFHPEEPHWYLPMIGVEPFAQNQGVAAELMRHVTRLVDEQQLPAYLEASSPRNVSLYLRHGFESVGEIQVGRAPVVTPMVRPACR
jgi:ribosomal protein S18 acetylase RimI-like enzyme